MQQDDMGEEKRDIAALLKKIPPQHAALVQGYHWKFHAGNTLNGDEEHVGYMDEKDREIAIAGPWNYGREFTILHEVAHKVWERYVQPNPRLVRQWEMIVAKTKNKQNQNAEELFCMGYANHYVKNRVTIHDHPQWHAFVELVAQMQ